jgi:hypothetical protein
MLHVAHACDGAMPKVPTVFSSRHGDCTGAVELMTELAHEAPVTAGAFSHSVHNTAAGLYSIVGDNAQPSSSTAGGAESFGSGIIEALAVLARSSEGRVLLVVADAPLPDVFEPFTEEPSAPYAVGLLLARGGEGARVTFSLGRAAPASSAWPDAVEFLRWLLSNEPATAIGRARNRLDCARG